MDLLGKNVYKLLFFCSNINTFRSKKCIFKNVINAFSNNNLNEYILQIILIVFWMLKTNFNPLQ